MFLMLRDIRVVLYTVCTPFVNYTYRLVMLQCNVTCKLE